MSKIMAVLSLAALAVSPIFAQDAGLKDVYANKFRFGNIFNSTTVANAAMQNIVLKEFNSITPENELKPDATILNCNGSTNDDIKVSLNRAASILKFCEDHNIPVRGHTLVWHSQTPVCFFKDNFQDGGTWVTPEVMDKRMESYIKNMFAAIATQYPNLNLYAYDVVNEAAQQSGAGPRAAGDNSSGEGSMWVRVYGDNSFIAKAFKFARQYAPPTTKLFYNDFNEYMQAKRDYIADSILKPNFQAGNLDGMGMQSHLDVRNGGNNAWPAANEYKQAIQKFKDVGVEVQVTELDATLNEDVKTEFVAQAVYYRDIMKAILSEADDKLTAVVVWGIRDDQSWRSAKNPLLFDNSGAKKPAYDSLVALIPQAEWGDGNNVGGADGIYSLNIDINPASGGKVARNPASSKYAENAEVMLIATPNIGWVFDGWEGDVSGSQATTTITMNADKNATAKFKLGGDDYNLIKNGNFASNMTEWELNKWSGDASSSVANGEFSVSLSSLPDNVYDIQLVQQGVPLEQGMSYILSFNASASSPRTMTAMFQMAVDPWTTYYSEDVELTASKQSFSFEFTMDEETNLDSRFGFNFGQSLESINISDVKLVYSGYVAPSSSSSPSGNPSSSSSLDGNSPIKVISSAPSAKFQVRSLSSALLVESSANATIYLYNSKGSIAEKFNVPAGSSVVSLSVPAGLYVVKNAKTKQTQMVLVK